MISDGSSSPQSRGKDKGGKSWTRVSGLVTRVGLDVRSWLGLGYAGYPDFPPRFALFFSFFFLFFSLT